MLNQSTSQGFEFLDILAIISFLLQVQNNQQIREQASTDDIYAELRKQDQKYLEKILRNQLEIIKKLEKIESKIIVK